MSNRDTFWDDLREDLENNPEFSKEYLRAQAIIKELNKQAWSVDNTYDDTVVVEVSHERDSNDD